MHRLATPQAGGRTYSYHTPAPDALPVRSSANLIPMRGAGPWSSRAQLPRSFFYAQGPALRSFFSFSLPSARTQLPSRSFTQNTLFPFRTNRFLPSRLRSPRRLKSDNAAPKNGDAAEAPLTLSQRMKKLSREYGYAAVGVYFALSALDFPFCFLAVRALGTERIGHYEHVVVDTFKNTFGLKKNTEGNKDEAGRPIPDEGGDLGIADDLEEAQAANTGAGACTLV